MKRYICENCGNDHDGSFGSGRFCSKSCQCSFIAKKVKHRGTCQKGKHKTSPYGTWKCRFCGKIFETRYELTQHKKIDHSDVYKNAWNKGLTKETDERVKSIGQKYHNGVLEGKIIPPQFGKSMPQNVKAKISKSMKKYFQNNPEKVYYRLNHSSHENYAENYFKEILDSNSIKYVQNFYFHGYYLDFAFEDLKIDLEIDGAQHKNDPKIVERDITRNEVIQNSGWKIIRVFWPLWKCLTEEKKKAKVNLLVNALKENTLSEQFLQLV